ncbi:hypothetical protein V8G54_010991 [Vigna mungo]|uniref:Uncharacterized protein n=1 Tax=Vigna mungo TaxID=3915 RepID=A0AAQ3NMX5_VIGMU
MPPTENSNLNHLHNRHPHDPHKLQNEKNAAPEGKTAQKEQNKRKQYRPIRVHAKPNNPRSKHGREDSPIAKRKVKKWKRGERRRRVKEAVGAVVELKEERTTIGSKGDLLEAQHKQTLTTITVTPTL